MFFLSKLFFLGEDDEKTIADLQQELEESRKSAGTGMALSYFFNFVLPTAAHMPSAGELAMIDVEVGRGVFEASRLNGARNELLIIVPRCAVSTERRACEFA